MSDHANQAEREASRRLLAEIGGERLSSHDIAARLKAGEGGPLGTTGAEEAPLLPALHRLESDGKLRAGWEPNTTGKLRRRYRAR